MQPEITEYDIQEQKKHRQRQMMFVISRILKGFVYIVKVVLEAIAGVLVGVLKTFKVPIPKI